MVIRKYSTGVDEVDLYVTNQNGENPLQIASRFGLIDDSVTRGDQRSRRSINADRKTSYFEEEKGQVPLKTLNRSLLDSNSETGSDTLGAGPSSLVHKKQEAENGNKIKNRERMQIFHRVNFMTGIKKDTPLPISENMRREKDIRMAPRIQDQGEAREYSPWPTTYEATSNENASFIKWLFYFFGRHSLVKRMHQAEQSSILQKNGGLPDKLKWTEKRLYDAMARYDKW